MLDLYDAKTLISAYKYIERTCNAIDEFIFKHAINYGPDPEYSSTYDVINNIVNLMERKNKLIKLKDTIDETVKSMKPIDRKILIIRMRFRTSVKNLQKILSLPSERTTFRRLEHAIESFQLHLNATEYAEQIKNIIGSENWIYNIRRTMANVATI